MGEKRNGAEETKWIRYEQNSSAILRRKRANLKSATSFSVLKKALFLC